MPQHSIDLLENNSKDFKNKNQHFVLDCSLQVESLCSPVPMEGWLQPKDEAWFEYLVLSQPSRFPPGQLQQNLLQFFTLLRSDGVTVLTDTSCKRVLKLGAPTSHICFKCQPDNVGVTGQNSLVCALQEVKP